MEWNKVVWHKDEIPMCSFIFWLACKHRLRTRDNLKRWGVIEDSTRVCYVGIVLKSVGIICFLSVGI